MVGRIGHSLIARHGPAPLIAAGNGVNVGPMARLLHAISRNLGKGPESLQNIGKLGPHVIHFRVRKFETGERRYVPDVSRGQGFQMGFQKVRRSR